MKRNLEYWDSEYILANNMGSFGMYSKFMHIFCTQKVALNDCKACRGLSDLAIGSVCKVTSSRGNGIGRNW